MRTKAWLTTTFIDPAGLPATCSNSVMPATSRPIVFEPSSIQAMTATQTGTRSRASTSSTSSATWWTASLGQTRRATQSGRPGPPSGRVVLV